MGQRYTFNYLWVIIIAAAISINFAFNYGPGKGITRDTIYLRKTKPNQKQSYLKNGLSTGTLPPLKPSPYANIKPTIPVATDKLLTNVQIYPNPITDQINIKYTVSRNSNVTIKIMDVLGNNVATLLSERVDSGEQKFARLLSSNKLTSGFYFLRVTVGTESIIKRITIL
ncbi:T9SS type A sorting domain-containing protein [Mucilaginibacter terrae]|uniref:T9SS type A sorting domain-containing protein n=1 Tax=Mucilaginibacter terrae TaxID=1955052 RepID=UPI00362DABE0